LLSVSIDIPTPSTAPLTTERACLFCFASISARIFGTICREPPAGRRHEAPFDNLGISPPHSSCLREVEIVKSSGGYFHARQVGSKAMLEIQFILWVDLIVPNGEPACRGGGSPTWTPTNYVPESGGLSSSQNSGRVPSRGGVRTRMVKETDATGFFVSTQSMPAAPNTVP
jgi:hypothetical protein